MNSTRRQFLALATTAAAISVPWVRRACAAYAQPPLPFPETALAPTISAQTVGLHYGKHQAAYHAALDRLTPKTEFEGLPIPEIVRRSAGKPEFQAIFNNAGQAWNHEFYWAGMVPGGARQPTGALAQAIERDLGGVDAFKAKFVETGTGVFGSGWVWLVEDGGKLVLMPTPGGDNPVARGKKALLGVDVWEHAYYLDYQNRRADHIKAVLDNIVNWDVVRDRMAT